LIKVISPKFHSFASKYTNVKFVQIDVDEVPDVAEKCNVRAMPTFQFYKDGKMVDEVVGADPAKLEAVLQKYN
jgi:thioredoxin 1